MYKLRNIGGALWVRSVVRCSQGIVSLQAHEKLAFGAVETGQVAN
jgi:hypothetical protein